MTVKKKDRENGNGIGVSLRTIAKTAAQNVLIGMIKSIVLTSGGMLTKLKCKFTILIVGSSKCILESVKYQNAELRSA